MARQHAPSQLEKKYARLAGQLDVIDREVEPVIGFRAVREKWDEIARRKKDMRTKLAAIACAIQQFEPDWDPASVKPIHSRPRHRKFGDGAKATWHVLREAGEPLSRRQLARRVAAKLGLEGLDERGIARVESLVDGLCRRHEGKTTVRYDSKPTLWALAPKRPRASATPPSKSGRPDAGQPSA